MSENPVPPAAVQIVREALKVRGYLTTIDNVEAPRVVAALPRGGWLHDPAEVEPVAVDERDFVEQALRAADAGDAGHWPTVAGYLADEVRRLRAVLAP